jgi:hypothetical protein
LIPFTDIACRICRDSARWLKAWAIGLPGQEMAIGDTTRNVFGCGPLGALVSPERLIIAPTLRTMR